MCKAGQRVLLTFTGPGPSFFNFVQSESNPTFIPRKSKFAIIADGYDLRGNENQSGLQTDIRNHSGWASLWHELALAYVFPPLLPREYDAAQVY